jgi:hypothetical protein
MHCLAPGCSRVFKTLGWLARHIKSNHTDYQCQCTQIHLHPLWLPMSGHYLCPVKPHLDMGQQREARGGGGTCNTSFTWLVLTLHSQVTETLCTYIHPLLMESIPNEGIALGLNHSKQQDREDSYPVDCSISHSPGSTTLTVLSVQTVEVS